MPELKAPLLSDDMKKGYRVGLRPFRSSGIRIEREVLDNKLIIHNYGHGGAGITLSWGSALSAIALMGEQPKNERLAIIGAGAVGLATAIKLTDLGYHICIYAKDLTPNTTSDVAGAHWSPFLVASGKSAFAKKLFATIKDQSKINFLGLATQKKPLFPGVSLVDEYTFDPIQGPKRTPVRFDNGKNMWASVDKTILINTTVYLNGLMDELEKRKVVIQTIGLTRNDIRHFPEKVIFNCSGLGAKELFDDSDLRALRGYLIEFMPQSDINYFALSDLKKGSKYFTCLFSHSDKLLIGGSVEDNEWSEDIDAEICENILRDAKIVFGS